MKGNSTQGETQMEDWEVLGLEGVADKIVLGLGAKASLDLIILLTDSQILG